MVEAAGGQPLGDALHDRLFEPLGLGHTLLPASTSTSLPEPYSHGYDYGSSSVALYGEPEYTAETVAQVEAGTLQPTDYTGVNHSFAAAAGGVVSTAEDLANWMEALVGGKVLSPEYQQIWADSPKLASPDTPGYAYGYGIARNYFGSNSITYHGGETAGYNSYMGVDAANGVTIVVWTNLAVGLDNKAAAFTLGADVFGQVYADLGQPSPAQPTTPAFEDVACPQPNIAGIPALDFPPEVRCGYLTVPEDRSKPDGRTIRIFVTRVPAVSPTPKPDPLVMMSGGPGGAGSFEFLSGIAQGLNAEREVIYVDQRGTHHADPLLSCPELDVLLNEAISVPFSADVVTVGQAAVIENCRHRALAAGVDIAAYDTAENAADIADLRVALGIDEWNVYGVSYGSKLALVVLRDHPEGIRSVVLDSVSPPNINIVENWWSAPASSFRAIFAACAAQPSCAAAYPDLEDDFYATVQRLDQTPLVVEAEDASGAPLTVNIDGYQFVYNIVMASERGDASGVPKMINDMARGDADSTVAAALSFLTPPAFVGLAGYGLAFTVFCSEAANLTTQEATLAKARASLPRFPDRVLNIQPKQGRLFTDCPAWGVGDADPSMRDPVISDVPVLILEGAFDAATAPEWVDVVTPGLERSQYVEFPFTGHAVLGKHECARSLMGAFLDRPGEGVDASCAAEVELTFVTS